MKNNWYPGSAFASEKWVSYLQSRFIGKWIFTDNNPFTEWTHLPGSRKRLDTLLNADQWYTDIDTLIISWHPGLKHSEDVINLGILNVVKPSTFIFDLGRNLGQIEDYINAADLFYKTGYNLTQIVVLPDLHHQFCEFQK